MRDDLEFAVLAYLGALDLTRKVIVGFPPGHPARQMIADTNHETYQKTLAGLTKCVREGPECELTFPVLTYLKLLGASVHSYDGDRPSQSGAAYMADVTDRRKRAEQALRDMVGANR
jgi:hypothetical protein